MTTTTEITEIRPVELDGFTGLDDDTAEGNARYHASMDRWKAANPDANVEEYTREGMRLIALNDVLRRYNTLRPRLLEEQVAREERDKALQTVENLWEALGNPNATESWLHTHQAYVRAVDDARITVDMWKTRAVEAKKIVFVSDGTGTRDETYQQILAAGHPPVEPLAVDPATVAEQLLANLDQAVEYRGRLAAQTLDLVAQAIAR